MRVPLNKPEDEEFSIPNEVPLTNFKLKDLNMNLSDTQINQIYLDQNLVDQLLTQDL